MFVDAAAFGVEFQFVAILVAADVVVAAAVADAVVFVALLVSVF